MEYIMYLVYCDVDGVLQSTLVPEASEFSQWEVEGAESGCAVTAVIPVWRNLTTLDMSNNCIGTIDSSVVRYVCRTSTQTGSLSFT